jgi:AI-2 transport protein TqsA
MEEPTVAEPRSTDASTSPEAPNSQEASAPQGARVAEPGAASRQAGEAPRPGRTKRLGVMHSMRTSPTLLDGPMKMVWALAGVVIVIMGMRYMRSILNPVLLALFIVMAVSPLIRWLRGKRVPNGLTLLIVLSLVLVVGLVFAAIVATTVQQFQDKLPEYQGKLDTMLHDIDTWLLAQGINATHLLTGALSASRLATIAKDLATSLFGAFSQVLLMFLVVVFMVAEIFEFPAKIDSHYGSESRFAKASGVFGHDARSYLFLKTSLGLVTSILVTAIFYGFGVDFALLWGVLFFLLGFIPNFGIVIALVPPFIVALLEQGFLRAAIMIVAAVVVNTVMDNLISPRVMGRGLGLTPLAVFLSLVFWAWVLGPVGALISVPLTIMVKRLFLESYENTLFLSAALSPRDTGKRRRGARRTQTEAETEKETVGE